MLRANNVEFTIVEYLKEPLSIQTLGNICNILGVNPASIVRVNDRNYKELKLDLKKLKNHQILKLIAKNPKILERPIIIKNNVGVIGRPPENVENLF